MHLSHVLLGQVMPALADSARIAAASEKSCYIYSSQSYLTEILSTLLLRHLHLSASPVLRAIRCCCNAAKGVWEGGQFATDLNTDAHVVHR